MLRRTALVALATLATLHPRPAAAQPADPFDLYEARRLAEVLELLPDSAFDGLAPAEQLLHLRAEARGGLGYHAARQVEPLLAASPHDPDVLATAAVTQHSAGRLDRAAELARAALALDPSHLEALRVDAMLRLHRHDFEGALTSWRAARRAHPERVGGAWDVLFGQSISEGLGDAAVEAEAVAARADRHARAGDDEAAEAARVTSAMYRSVGGRALFTASTASDVVSLPFEKCWDGTPYRCIDLPVGDTRYRVLVDSGNEYGFGVHDRALRDALATRHGGATSVTTGSVDSAFVASEFFADRVDFGGLAVIDVPAIASPKVREPWFDANLNPFFLRGRVITLDYVEERVLVRTKERFERDLAAAPAGSWVRVPMYDIDRPYVPATVNGHRATALIETGAEVLSMTRQFAREVGLPLRPGKLPWGDRVLDVERTDIDVRLDGRTFYRDSVEVFNGRVADQCSGLLYDVMIGPGSLEGAWSLTWDPFTHEVVLERGAATVAAEAGTEPDPSRSPGETGRRPTASPRPARSGSSP